MLEYEGTRFTMDHFKVISSVYLSLISLIYLERVVSHSYNIFLQNGKASKDLRFKGIFFKVSQMLNQCYFSVIEANKEE